MMVDSSDPFFMDSFDESLGEAAAIENDIQHLSLQELCECTFWSLLYVNL